MDVDSFIAKYSQEWRRLEERCSGDLSQTPGAEIDETVRLYLRTSAHLAEARSRYRDPSLETYLNRLVATAHGAVYAARPATVRGGIRFFGRRYRQAVRDTAPFIAAAAALMVVVALASLLWIATSPEAAAGVIPAAARDAIRRGGGSGSLAVPPAGLSTVILLNNVQVAFLAFALGITLGVGTIYVVVQNALLLGVLGGAFQAAGHAGTFWSLILPHGLLELTAICISAGAGLRIGWSIVDPGDRSRGAALVEASRDAVLVVLGVIPAFCVAALIEGFVTGRGLPDSVELALGAVVAAGYVAFLFGRFHAPGREPSRGVATAAPST
ncbi:MAG: stage II sporulation protein M [Actinomycetota bacterium]